MFWGLEVLRFQGYPLSWQGSKRRLFTREFYAEEMQIRAWLDTQNVAFHNSSILLMEAIIRSWISSAHSLTRFFSSFLSSTE